MAIRMIIRGRDRIGQSREANNVEQANNQLATSKRVLSMSRLILARSFLLESTQYGNEQQASDRKNNLRFQLQLQLQL